MPDLTSPLRPLRVPHALVPDWVFSLPLTLEDLYYCTTHHYRITRTRRRGGPQLVKIDIKVSPSWRTGTRIRFSSVGNQRGDGTFQDIVFVVREVPHPHFTRVGDDLHMTVHLPAPQGHLVRSRPTHFAHVPDVVRIGDMFDDEVFVRTLNGEELALPVPRSLAEGANGAHIIGGGMPAQYGGKHVGKGDMFIRYVDFWRTPSPCTHFVPQVGFRPSRPYQAIHVSVARHPQGRLAELTIAGNVLEVLDLVRPNGYLAHFPGSGSEIDTVFHIVLR